MTADAEAKGKISQLFEFIQAFTVSKHPIKRRLDEQPLCELQLKFDALPQSSEWIEWWDGDEDAREWLLRVKLRPPYPCPPPSAQIRDWLLPGWERYDKQAVHAPDKSFRSDDGTTRVQRFEDHPTRVAAWSEWTNERQTWADIEQRHEPVRSLFTTLQTLRAELQKRAEQVELVLGVAMLMYQGNEISYAHPLILKSLGLEFDIQENRFSLSETDKPTELYSEPLADLGIDLAPASEWRERLKRRHPLDAETRTMVKSIGEWIRGTDGFAGATISLDPVIFLRDRGGWPARAATAVLEDLANKPAAQIPDYLCRLAGLKNARSEDAPETASENAVQLANEDGDILFALPANMEQLMLARQLERKDAVLVQGPPGTGKTHTIANLLGHLLAQGKRVLVTSHTSKALRVLRDKVPENIRSLCVSVIDDPSRSRKELDDAVRAIAEGMQKGQTSLRDLAERKTADRRRLIEEIRNLRLMQRDCVKAEYDEIVIGGEAFTPSEAARFVREGTGRHDWIPGPLKTDERGKVCPLSVSDVESLYRSQQQISEQVEIELRAGLPAEGWLPSTAVWVKLVNSVQSLKTQADSITHPIWAHSSFGAEILKSTLGHLEQCIQEIAKIEAAGTWLLDLVEAGFDQGSGAVWKDLKSLVDATIHCEAVASSSVMEYAPELPAEFRTEDVLTELKAIYVHVEGGRGLAIWQLAFTSPGKAAIWRKLIQQARCNGHEPKISAEWQALSVWLELHLQREKLRRRWQRQVEILGASALPDATPEVHAAQWLPHIERALQWSERYWLVIPEKIAPFGKPWADIKSLVPPQSGSRLRLNHALRLLEEHLLPEFRAWLAQRECECIGGWIAERRKRLRREVPNMRPGGVIADIDTSLSQMCVDGYGSASMALQKLRDLLPIHQKRDKLLAALDGGASAWAIAISQRVDHHNISLPAGRDIALAWRWRQFHDELAYRHQLNAEEIAKKLEEKNRELERVTGELIAESAWSKQLSAAERFRQSLVGWLDLMKRVGKGTGSNAEHFRVQAREQLRDGQNAVPVWIMPMAQVFQSFTAADAAFDVVIVDEASQAGLEGLLAACLGKKLVVVGDHEQVSPDGVGQQAVVAKNLQAQYLDGIPNAALYDGQLSLYDLIRQSSSGMLSLSEHFRCVPSIIGFSNRLSYDGRIKPLREASSSKLRPIIAHRVNGQREGRSKINREEAQVIVSLIAAMCRHEAYGKQSIGVISLLGEEQARLIEKMLREHLPIEEIETRKIICGNAAQFQGDERKVILLSMVDSNEGDGPMKKQGEGANESAKKRFNVAASRAQDQMWIVHSLSHATDLKPGDLRRELLDYAYAEIRQGKEAQIDDPKHDSEFERLVARELKSRGFRVYAQYPVGFYRIDLVVEGNGKKLAVECDGDRWHSGSEKIAEDLARQAVLERLGWKFHRIRGSEFFREPVRSVDRLLRRLAQLEIHAETSENDGIGNEEADVIHEEVLRLAQEIRTGFFGGDAASAASPSLQVVEYGGDF